MNRLQLCIDCEISHGDVMESLKASLLQLLSQLGDESGSHDRPASNGKGHSANHPLAGSAVNPASRKQIGFLIGCARRHRGYDTEKTRQWVADSYGIDLNALTKKQAPEAIDMLQSQGGEHGGE